MLGVSFQTSRAANASSSTSQPLKAAKKYRPDDDADKQIVRCKRKLDFIADRMKISGERVTSTSGDPIYADLPRPVMTSRRRPPDIVARRNERERKRVSLINRTFETLRDQLPVSSWGHRHIGKVSKVETLRAAIEYIRTLQDLLSSTPGDDEELDGDDALDSDVKSGDVNVLTRHDVAVRSAERLGALSSGAVLTGSRLFVPTLDFRLPTDSEEMYATNSVGRRHRDDAFPVSIDGSARRSAGNDDVESRIVQRMILQQQQRERRMQVFDATQRLAQLTAGVQLLVDTSAKDDYGQMALDINSNLCAVDDWLENGEVDAFPSSTSSVSIGDAEDSVSVSEFSSVVEARSRHYPFGGSSGVNAGHVVVAELERYLLEDTGDDLISRRRGATNSRQSVV